MIRDLVERRERPMSGVDLEAPGEVGGLAVELLVPPVADPSDGLGDEKAGSEAVGEEPDICPGPLRDHGADDDPAAIPPQTPRPPFQIANGPHHCSGTSLQLVATW